MSKLLALLALGTVATPALASAQAVTAGDPQSVARVMQEAGYKAEVTKDTGGDPMIRSSSGGYGFSVFFFGCEKGANCKEIQFWAGWQRKAAPARVNEWNRDKRFGRAYLDKDGDINVEYDINLEAPGGISAALFKNDLELWAGLMGSFENEMREPAPAKQ